jgi:hypothetical protein
MAIACMSTANIPAVECNETLYATISGMQLSDDPTLKRFRAALDEICGDRIERVVLFGSRAGRCRRGFGLRRRGVPE